MQAHCCHQILRCENQADQALSVPTHKYTIIIIIHVIQTSNKNCFIFFGIKKANKYEQWEFLFHSSKMPSFNTYNIIQTSKNPKGVSILWFYSILLKQKCIIIMGYLKSLILVYTPNFTAIIKSYSEDIYLCYIISNISKIHQWIKYPFIAGVFYNKYMYHKLLTLPHNYASSFY